MEIDLIISAKDVDSRIVKDKIVIVIDVLRATSTMITALNNGATAIVPFKEIDDALSYAKNNINIVLGGERFAKKIEGFDYGNSPLEYKKENIAGKEVVITTTNGTLAIENSRDAKQIYIMSFLNCKAVVDILKQREKDIVIVCAGTNGEYSADDALCAGMFINLILEYKEVELSDIALTQKQIYEFSSGDIHKCLKKSKHYNTLMDIRLDKDLEYCLNPNLIDIVLYYKDGKIII